MIAENHHYGHAAVVRSYAGLGRPLPIPGRLQHGWMPGPAVRPAERNEPWMKLVWSSRNLDQSRALGFERVLGFGAPFLYLPELEAPPTAKKSLLVFPFHGWEKEPLRGNMGLYAAQLEELAGQGFGPVTVCLYWAEYEDGVSRGVFEERGFRVITMGRRDGSDTFLQKLRLVLLEHAFVTSNRVCTAAFYALHCRRPFFLYGPAMGVSEYDDPSGEKFDAWQRSEFPQLDFARFDGSLQGAMGDAELGLEFKRSPQEVRELFAWRKQDLLRRAKQELVRRAYPLLRKFSR